MVLVQNGPVSNFFFKQYTPGKCLLRDSRTNKTLLYAIKTKSSKSRKIGIFSKGLTHGFDLQMAVFPNFIFQAIQAREISFTILYIEKTPLQPMKTKSPKGRKTDIFPNGLTHSFGPNFAFFKLFFLGNIGQENVFYGILERENTFLGYKNQSFKKSKNRHFSKRVTHGFCPKMALFLPFSFRQDIPGKCLLRDSRTKKRLCSL